MATFTVDSYIEQMVTPRNGYRYLYFTGFSTYTHISLLCQLRGPRSNVPVPKSILNAQILVSHICLQWRSQNSLGKWLTVGLGKETDKVTLQHGVGPKSKELLTHKTRQNWWRHVKEIPEPNERAPNGQSGRIWVIKYIM